MSLIAKLTRTWSDDVDSARDAIIDNVCSLISCRAPIWPQGAGDETGVSDTIAHLGIRNVTRSQSKSSSDVLVAEITDLIRRYEPRLSQVEIDVQESSESHNQLRFRISAVMETRQGDEAIVLDSFLDLSSNKLDVRKSNLV
ncbi:type VI secretion system baseplate subunit TssE [Photobacterium marinum]|uniref:type VI secretion system baseplate subunit TssE n=1 Tax=Photobacterium marinum TaxID=1056511 RepID=UPI00056C6AEA|nr:type VI secretion system baseplate subunit TssE [Photobacterium marinum]